MWKSACVGFHQLLVLLYSVRITNILLYASSIKALIKVNILVNWFIAWGIESEFCLTGAGASGVSMNVNPIEALLGTPGAFPPMLDIPPDADDETMVELAIALSLQVSKLTVII